MNRLDYLIQFLINEDPQYSELQIPETEQGKRDLFRALRNVRWPKPVSEEFLRLQDEELQAQLQERGVVKLDDIVGVCRMVCQKERRTLFFCSTAQRDERCLYADFL